MDFSLGFTGTQKSLTLEQHKMLATVLHSYAPMEGHHGCCIGADREFHELMVELHPRTKMIGWPAFPDQLQWANAHPFYRVYGLNPPLVRNRFIVEYSAQMIACPRQVSEVLRSGTWATIRYAKKIHVPVAIIFPDGNVRRV